MLRAFVIRPIGTKKDVSGKEIDFERIHHELIAPALEAVGLGGGTTGNIIDLGNIREDMFGLIIEADLVVCDITVHNANVFYALGIRHALRKKGTVLIKGAPVADSTPFDILTARYLEYSVDEPFKKRDGLADVFRATLASSREIDSPLFKMLSTLPEVDPASVQVVPTDFTEEVTRATAAKAAGWLRLLAAEVAGLRFRWPALRLIGRAQWKLGDWDGARRTWEQVVRGGPDDIEANLALARVYERQFQRDKTLDRFEASNKAIARVLEARGTTTIQRAEALALRGRNHKTLWRLEWESAATVEERREAAINPALRASYEAYNEAFYSDLNHYWAGLAALQMGTIFLHLSESDAWGYAFDDDDEAEVYKRVLVKNVDALRLVVPASVRATLRRPDTPEDRPWAELSMADILFLTES